MTLSTDNTDSDPRGALDIEGGASPVLIRTTRYTADGETTSIYACGPVRASLAAGMADVVAFARIQELQADRDAAVTDHEQGLEIQNELSNALAVLLGEASPEPCSPGCRTPHLSEAANARINEALKKWTDVVIQRDSAQAAVKEYEKAAAEWAEKLREASVLMGKAEHLQAVVARLVAGSTFYASCIELEQHGPDRIDGEALEKELRTAADFSLTPLLGRGALLTLSRSRDHLQIAVDHVLDRLQENGTVDRDLVEDLWKAAGRDGSFDYDLEIQEPASDPTEESQEVRRRGRK